MKTVRPIGIIRPLATILGRARRRWRGGSLAPMIWRRRLRARPSSPRHQPAPPSSVAHADVFNITLVWPAGIAARAAPLRPIETTLGERLHAGRLVALVERLWLRPAEDGPGAKAVPARRAAPGLVSPLPHAGRRQNAPDATLPGEGGAQAAAPAASAEIEARGAKPRRAGAPRINKPRPMRVGAIRHGSDPAETTSRAPAGDSAAASRGPARPRASLVWRKDEAGGEGLAAAQSHGRPFASLGSERVWRRPAAAPIRDEAGPGQSGEASATGRSDGHARADRPVAPAPAAPAPAAMQPAEMSRLVDEVVRRLDRIGRDERMRRGV